METGKMINRISNRLRRRSLQIQTKLGISGAQGNVLDYILIESESILSTRRRLSRSLDCVRPRQQN